MIKSNGQDIYARLRNNIQNLKNLGTAKDAATRVILFSTLALIKKRVFENGEKADGGKIGTYSNSYMKIRKANNWSGSNIILELTGEMRREFILDVSNGKWVIGFLRGNGDESYTYKKEFSGNRKSKNNPSGSKGIRRVTTTAPVSGYRAEILEKKYGTIFQMSKIEIDQVLKAFDFEIKKRLNG